MGLIVTIITINPTRIYALSCASLGQQGRFAAVVSRVEGPEPSAGNRLALDSQLWTLDNRTIWETTTYVH